MIIHGDCIEEMAKLPAESVDAICTDPPYGISFMGKDWDQFNSEAVAEKVRKNDYTKEGMTSSFSSPAKKAGIYDQTAEGNRRFQEWSRLWAIEALRVLKPGGHMLVFGGTRTYHRMTSGIEDAGFEIRDEIVYWLYSTGFPKSLDVSKAIDKAARRTYVEAALSLGVLLPGRSVDDWTKENHSPGDKWWEKFKEAISPGDWQRIEREVVGRNDRGPGWFTSGDGHAITAPATSEAAKWQGWGTALKPAHEPIVVARKPLAGTVAGNVLKHGTGALNIDASRIGTPDNTRRPPSDKTLGMMNDDSWVPKEVETGGHALGRWPANVILSHSPECRLVGKKVIGKGEPSAAFTPRSNVGFKLSEQNADRSDSIANYGEETVDKYACVLGCPVAELDRQSGDLHPAGNVRPSIIPGAHYGVYGETYRTPKIPGDSGGGASRFFYVAKASRSEREKGLGPPLPCLLCKRADEDRERGEEPKEHDKHIYCSHPTIKPTSLMRFLVKLVTPPGGTVLDPFMGSGTTGIACVEEVFEFIGIEREAEYVAIAKARIAAARAPTPALDEFV